MSSEATPTQEPLSPAGAVASTPLPAPSTVKPIPPPSIRSLGAKAISDAKTAAATPPPPAAPATGDTKPEGTAAPAVSAPAGDAQAGGQPPPAAAPSADDIPEGADEKTRELYAKLPPEVRKDLNRHFTQKSQTISAQAAFLKAMQDDPVGTTKQIVAGLKQRGMAIDLVEKPAVPAAADPVIDDAQRELTSLFGEEAAKAMLPVLQKISGKSAEAATAPLVREQEQVRARAAATEANAEFEAFKTRHPDWSQHYSKMNELALKFTPSDKATIGEWFDFLYEKAAFPSLVAAEVQKTLDRMKSSAASSEAPSNGISAPRVAPAPPAGRLPTLRESAQAAMRGERWG